MDRGYFEAWQKDRSIEEDLRQYRADASWNQSLLKAVASNPITAFEEQERRRSISHFEKGSAVDYLLTFPGSTVTDGFAVLTATRPANRPDEILSIIEERGLDWTEDVAMQIADEIQYGGANAKEETRRKNLKGLFEYMAAVTGLPADKDILTYEEMLQVNGAYNRLKNDDIAYPYCFDQQQSGVYHFPQLPLYGKVTLPNGKIAPVKGLLDRMIVDFNSQTITIIDYKTMAGATKSFPASFLKLRYDIQSALYTKLVRMQDWYDSEFTVKFIFVVVSLTNEDSPLVYSVPPSILYGNWSDSEIIYNARRYLTARVLLENVQWYSDNPQLRHYPPGYSSENILSLEDEILID